MSWNFDMHLRKLLTIIVMLIVIIMMNIVLVGCVYPEEGMSVWNSTAGTEASVDMRYIGEQEAKLAGIDATVILVDGVEITKRAIEIKKIHNYADGSKPLKEIIDPLIQSAVISAEAKRLGIEPEPDEIDAYIGQAKIALESKASGTEYILDYIEGKGITLEEYLSDLEKEAYSMFQRDAFRRHVEIDDAEYEEYIGELIKKADIKILDPDIEALYK